MLELTFRHDGHVTTNTFRFEEVEEETKKPIEKGSWIIGKLYLQKSIFAEIGVEAPKEITVKVEW